MTKEEIKNKYFTLQRILDKVEYKVKLFKTDTNFIYKERYICPLNDFYICVYENDKLYFGDYWKGFYRMEEISWGEFYRKLKEYLKNKKQKLKDDDFDNFDWEFKEI